MRGWCASAVLFLAVLAAPASEPDPEAARADVAETARIVLIERLVPAVGAVFRENGAGGGSGVVISPDGYALTNQHVTGNSTEMRVGLPDGKLYRAKVIGVDPMGDIALIRLLGRTDFPYVPLGDSDTLRVGDWTIAMGNPFLLATDFRPTVTLGIVSGVHRYQPGRAMNRLVYPDCIQVDTPINPGNSGGPLFDAAGRLVGINGRISVGPRGRNNVGVGFAVSVNQIRKFLPDLRAGKWVDHGTLDATVRDEEEPDGRRRTIFDRMYDDSVAALAGILLGDELISFDGRPVRGANDFLNRITVLPAGWEVEVVVRRTDEDERTKEHTFRIELAAIPTATETDRKKHVIDEAHVVWETKRLLARNLARWGDTAEETYAGEGFRVLRRGNVIIRSRGGIVETVGPTDALRTVDGGERQEIPKVRAARLARDAALLGALASNDVAIFRDAKLLGGDRVEGRIADLVEATIGGVGAVFAFDTETGDCLRIEDRHEDPGGRVTFLFSDHRALSGGVRPYRIRTFLGRREVRDEVIESWVLREHVGKRVAEPPPPRPVEESAVRDAAKSVFPAIVKLHGASGFARLPSYATAVLVHPDGIALTVRSVILGTENLRAVLHDGTICRARVVARDDDRGMVAIRLEGPGPFPFLKPAVGESVRIGRWVLSVGNAFKLAEGEEQPSVNLGLLSAISRLDLRLGRSDAGMRERVYLTDANVNPGSGGGALVDLDGRLLGVLGKVVESRASRTLISHAVPIGDLDPLVKRAIDGAEDVGPAPEERPPGHHGIRLFRFGLHRSPPAYVDRVDRGSPAQKAGLRKNDLILRVGETTVPTMRAFRREMDRLRAGDAVLLTVKRGETVLKLRLVLAEVKR